MQHAVVATHVDHGLAILRGPLVGCVAFVLVLAHWAIHEQRLRSNDVAQAAVACAVELVQIILHIAFRSAITTQEVDQLLAHGSRFLCSGHLPHLRHLRLCCGAHEIALQSAQVGPLEGLQRGSIHVVDGALIGGQIAGVQTVLGGPIGNLGANAGRHVDGIGQHVPRPTAAAIQRAIGEVVVGLHHCRGDGNARARTNGGPDIREHLSQTRFNGLGIIGAEVAAPAIHGGVPEVVDGLRLFVIGRSAARRPDGPGLGTRAQVGKVARTILVVLVEFQGARHAHADHIGRHMLPFGFVVLGTSACRLDQIIPTSWR